MARRTWAAVARCSGQWRLNSAILLLAVWAVACAPMVFAPSPAAAQLPALRYGSEVPTEVRRIYERGLEYLAATQMADGSWSGPNENGITGLCMMAFLAGGEDPNFGRYAPQIQKALRSLLSGQDRRTGYLSNSMYHHGFATLALAEAYGAVDEALLWSGSEPVAGPLSIGQALERAVGCCLTAQRNNRHGAWRYSPQTADADTSVSGAVLVGLLAARNAGIEVPDEAIDKGLEYFRSSTDSDGSVAYSGGGGHGDSINRSAIATLVFAIGKRKHWPQYRATLRYLSNRLDHQPTGYPFYFRYYMSQALFQADFDAWSQWNASNIQVLRELQESDGSFSSSYGSAYGTAMALLSLGLNYRFLPIYER